jgi:hypothetical protein
MAGKTIYGVTPTFYCDLKCKRCGGRVIEDEIYYESGKAYQDLECLLCSEHFYLTLTEWSKQKNKMEAILRDRALESKHGKQSSVENRKSEILPNA